MASVTWTTHQGQKILYADYRTQNEAEQLAVLEEVGRLVQGAAPGVRNLSDFRGVGVGTAFMKRVKEINLAVFEPRQMRLAVLGVDGLKGMLLKGFNRVSRSGSAAVPCSSEEEAYKYLLS